MKKRALTLLEVMLVIFLITMIIGVLSFNMKGSLDKGRAFRTERAIEQLEEILLLRQAEGEDMKEMIDNPSKAIQDTQLCKRPLELLRDGWGEPLSITFDSKEGLTISSKKLNDYKNPKDPNLSGKQGKGSKRK